MNRLESELNGLSEENEALRDRLGVRQEEVVDVTGVRGRRASELDKLRTENRVLENEVCDVGVRGYCRYVGCKGLERSGKYNIRIA